ncbi:hypothetical protein HZC34_03750 [Candidatus Saganbacteria bacterium]|nr:hypothetical protein [Candidatus Saganbacteria bacterium]
MTKAIKERNRITLAAIELARDKNFHNIPHNERMHLISEVLALGENIANGISKEFGTSDPRKIADLMGVKISGDEAGNLKKSEYRKKEKQIVIFHDTLRRITSEITVPELSDRILRCLIAHELFHHIEEVKVGSIYKRFKFKGKLWFNYYIKGLSDVAAQAFTQKLLGLEFSPLVFDYLTYIMFTSDFKN